MEAGTLHLRTAARAYQTAFHELTQRTTSRPDPHKPAPEATQNHTLDSIMTAVPSKPS